MAGQELTRARAELDALLANDEWSDHTYVRSAALRDDIESLLIVHEWMRSDPDEDVEATRDWFLGEDLHIRVVAALERLCPKDDVVLDAVAADLALLRTTPATSSRPGLEVAIARAQAIIAEIDHDLAALIDRLGANPGMSPRATFAALVSRMDDLATSERLHEAWRAIREHHRMALVEAVDESIPLRSLGREAGSVSAEIEGFLYNFLDAATADSEELEDEIRIALPTAKRPLDHIGRLAASLTHNKAAVGVSLRECLAHAAAHLASALRVVIVVDEQPPFTVRVARGKQLLGEIVLDAWVPGAVSRTIGLRNRTELLGVKQLPIAYAQCRLSSVSRDPDQISVQGAHSVLHELGHGMQHVLSHGVMPSLSGMDRLPVERRETMALWCEKLLYRPGLSLPTGWSAVKALEIRRGLVQRAVVAIIDHDVFRAGEETSVVAVFNRLDETHGISRFCELLDVLEHFAEGPTATEDGSYYAYAVAAAASCINAADAPLQAWFDGRLPANLPNPAAVPAFYREPRMTATRPLDG